MKRLISKIVERWDWFIYWRACYSLERMAKGSGGFVYLMELRIREIMDRNPLETRFKDATERFHETLVKKRYEIQSEHQNPSR